MKSGKRLVVKKEERKMTNDKPKLRSVAVAIFKLLESRMDEDLKVFKLSQKTIGATVGVERRSVKSFTDELEGFNLIKTCNSWGVCSCYEINSSYNTILKGLANEA